MPKAEKDLGHTSNASESSDRKKDSTSNEPVCPNATQYDRDVGHEHGYSDFRSSCESLLRLSLKLAEHKGGQIPYLLCYKS